MATEEIRNLLPFYVAGTLQPEEKRRIDEALKSSGELRKDLQFWLHAQHAISAQAAYTAAGHVSASAIVDYAEGILAPGERRLVEHHLQSCHECSEEYRLVKSSVASEIAATPSLIPQLAAIIKSIRLVYAIPAVAAIIVAVVLYFSAIEKGSHQPSAQGHIPPIIAEIPHLVGESVPLWLTYQPNMRSTTRRGLPTLWLGEKHRQVDAFIAIPHNKLDEVRYHVEVEAGGRVQGVLADSLHRYASGSAYDSLHVVLLRSIIPQPGDTLCIVIREVFPSNLKELTAEEYRLSVVIKDGNKH
jgi:hypothetical protein